MNKNNVMIRLVCWSVVLVVLVNVLVFFLVGNGHFFRLPQASFHAGFYYKDESSYHVGAGTVDAVVDELEIHWLGGSVTVTPYDGDKVLLEEETGLSERNQLRWKAEGGTLIIQPRRPAWFLNFNRAADKNLVVRIPQSDTRLTAVRIDTISAAVQLDHLQPDRLQVDGTSGKISLADLAAKTVKLDVVSGDVTVERLVGEQLDIDGVSGRVTCRETVLEGLNLDTVSGDAQYQGALRTLDFDSTSGSLQLESSRGLTAAETDTVSGDSTFVLPKDSGFTASFDTVSGSFNSDFPLTTKGDQRTAGDGSGSFSFDSVSGDVTIKQQLGI